VCFVEGGDQRHIAIDGKTMRASKDGDGNATHVLSAFCAGLQSILGNEASRGKGMEIPDALKLLDRLDLKGRIVTGDAMFCQKSIVAKIVEKGGDYVLLPAALAGSTSIERRSMRPCVFSQWLSRKTGRASSTFAASRAFGKARKMANGKTLKKKSSI
jgi:hypothetical protein